MSGKSKKKNEELLSDEELINEVMEGGEEEPKPWLVVAPWNKDLIEEWKQDPEFLKYCEDEGIPMSSASAAKLKSGTESNPPEGLDPSNALQTITELFARLNTNMQMATQQPGTREDFDWVDFPEPKECEVDGNPADIPLEPINLGGTFYSLSGDYPPDVAKRLKKEIENARLVEVPPSAAFVRHRFYERDEDGRTKTEERVYSPGPVFAYGTLADSLEKQIERLEQVVFPKGEIPGGIGTTYDAIVTNGIRFTPGSSYLLPPDAKKDVLERISRQEQAFQALGRERNKVAGTSSFSGAPVSATEADIRKSQGKRPDEVPIPVGTF